MWIATHAVVGSTLGARLKKPVWVIIIIVTLSHVLLDLLPHWDYPISSQTLQNPIIDFIFAVIITSVIAYENQNKPACLLGALFAVLPDLGGIPLYYGQLSRYYFPSHDIGVLHNQSGPWWGVTVQIVVLLLSMSIALNKKTARSRLNQDNDSGI